MKQNIEGYKLYIGFTEPETQNKNPQLETRTSALHSLPDGFSDTTLEEPLETRTSALHSLPDGFFDTTLEEPLDSYSLVTYSLRSAHEGHTSIVSIRIFVVNVKLL